MKLKKEGNLREIFNLITIQQLTPNQFYVLFCIAQNTNPVKGVNLALECRNLQYEGWLNSENKLTDKALNIIKLMDSEFEITDQVKQQESVKSSDMIDKYLTLFPKGKIPSGKQARSAKGNLENAFKWFFKEYPELKDWNLILKATAYYVDEFESKNYLYMRTSQYFIRKQLTDKSWDSELANYCTMIKNGDDKLDQRTNYFSEKVV
jgi:hypothetical protein